MAASQLREDHVCRYQYTRAVLFAPRRGRGIRSISNRHSSSFQTGILGTFTYSIVNLYPTVFQAFFSSHVLGSPSPLFLVSTRCKHPESWTQSFTGSTRPPLHLPFISSSALHLLSPPLLLVFLESQPLTKRAKAIHRLSPSQHGFAHNYGPGPGSFQSNPRRLHSCREPIIELSTIPCFCCYRRIPHPFSRNFHLCLAVAIQPFGMPSPPSLRPLSA